MNQHSKDLYQHRLDPSLYSNYGVLQWLDIKCCGDTRTATLVSHIDSYAHYSSRIFFIILLSRATLVLPSILYEKAIKKESRRERKAVKKIGKEIFLLRKPQVLQFEHYGIHWMQVLLIPFLSINVNIVPGHRSPDHPLWKQMRDTIDEESISLQWVHKNVINCNQERKKLIIKEKMWAFLVLAQNVKESLPIFTQKCSVVTHWDLPKDNLYGRSSTLWCFCSFALLKTF